MVKKGTCFMTITQNNSNNVDEPIKKKKPTKADPNFFYDPRSEHHDRHNPESAPKFTADPRSTVFLKYANPLDIPQKFTIRAYSLILKPIHRPLRELFHGSI